MSAAISARRWSGFWSCCCSSPTRSISPPISARWRDATKLLIGGPASVYVVVFAAISVLAQIFFDYKRYVAILKWLTLCLFAYVIALAVVHVPWGEASRACSFPR